jgi:uncharacterized delta-60 repeat protein
MADQFALARYNPDGDLDQAFGTGGRVVTEFRSADAQAFAVATIGVDNELKIVAAGYAGDELALARYSYDGTPDRLGGRLPFLGLFDFGFKMGDNFRGDGKVTTSIPQGRAEARAMAIDRNGAITVAGVFRPAQSSLQRLLVARYHPDGRLDGSFNNTGTVTTSFPDIDALANALAIDPDGKLVVGGSASASKFALARYHPDGSLDNSFGNSGRVITDLGIYAYITGVQISPHNRKITVAGTALKTSGLGYRLALARYETDGSLDQTFGDSGTVKTDFDTKDTAQGNAIVTVAIGEVVVAGTAADDIDHVFHNRIALARYRSDGSLHPTFGNSGKALSDFAATGNAVARGPLQTVLVAGRDQNVTSFSLARFEQSGDVDIGFRNSGRTTTGFPGMTHAEANAMTVDPFGRIVLAGYANPD